MNSKNILVLFLLSCMQFTQQAEGAERVIKITDNYLHIPVSHSCDRVKIWMSCDGMDDMPVNVRITDGTPDYWVFKDVQSLKGKKLKITYPDGVRGIEAIRQDKDLPDADKIYKERNRPQYHFTARRGWINDPNGLIYKDGEYHLFFQHNPYERDRENMHWGHAVSTDLVHWRELPTALHPDRMGTMFSGSAVIDYDNTSGFGSKNNPPMVVAYTAETGGRQVQCIAYSLDNGRTFIKYKGNPVIDSKEKWNTHDTRDPKLLRYDDHWVMVLNERDGHSFYTSDNLRDWTFKSHITGFWECPDLFELAVDGDEANKMWVLYGASGTYMLGDFDGEKFTPLSGKHCYTRGTLYAAQTFNNIPAEDGRRIQIGWSRIGHPGENFNGMMLMPTELRLKTTKDGVRLTSQPVKEIKKYCKPVGKWENLSQREATDVMARFDNPDCLRVKVTLQLSHATDGRITLARQNLIDYDLNGTTINGWFYSPENPESMEITADIYIDRTSVEIFVDDGRYSYSMGRDLPGGEREGFRFHGNNITIKSLEVYEIPSIWETKDDVFFADPTIIRVGGSYYMAGTQYSNPSGFTVIRSTDLLEWSPAPHDTKPNLTPGEDVYGTKWFWAPQFVPTDSCVYMFYTANEQIAFAKADSINCTYKWNGTAIDDSEHNIDPFLFTDPDGRNYLYHVRFDNGNWLWVGEFDFNTGHFVEGTLTPIFRNDQDWENTSAFESVPIMEGPTVIRRGDTYYLFYSANHYQSPDYAVGYATAKSPLGPWTKNPANPIIHRNIVGESGSGHGDVFTDADGNLRYVYHVHNSDTVANPRRSRIVSLKIDDNVSPAAITVDTATIIHPSVR